MRLQMSSARTEETPKKMTVGTEISQPELGNTALTSTALTPQQQQGRAVDVTDLKQLPVFPESGGRCLNTPEQGSIIIQLQFCSGCVIILEEEVDVCRVLVDRSQVGGYTLENLTLKMEETLNEDLILSTYKLIGSSTKTPANMRSLGQQSWISGKKRAGFLKQLDDQSFDERRDDNTPVGLVNLGATCYANTFLQVFFHNKAFRKAIFAWMPSKDSSDFGKRLMYELQRTFAYLQCSKKRHYTPDRLVEALGLERHVHQDMTEFQQLIWMFVHEELKSQVQNILDIQLFLQHMSFEGTLRRTTTCLTCKSTSTSTDTFGEIPVHLKALSSEKSEDCTKQTKAKGHGIDTRHTIMLEEAITKYLEDELLNGDNKYYCSKCSSSQEGKLGYKLNRLPDRLNFHVMRFDVDWNTGRRKKLKKVVEFPDALDMQSFLESTTGDATYKLQALVLHRGSSAHSGHYIAQILVHGQSPTWFIFDDDYVTPISAYKGKPDVGLDTESATFDRSKVPSTVLGRFASDCVYLLTYIRRSKVTVEQFQHLPDPPLPKDLITETNETNTTFIEEYERKASQMMSDEAYINRVCDVIEQFAKHISEEKKENTDFSELEWVPKEFIVKFLKQQIQPPSSTPSIDQTNRNLVPLDITSYLCKHNFISTQAVDKLKIIPRKCVDFIASNFPDLIIRRLLLNASSSIQCVPIVYMVTISIVKLTAYLHHTTGAACCLDCIKDVQKENLRKSNVQSAQRLLRKLHKDKHVEVPSSKPNDLVLVSPRSLSEFENLRHAPRTETVFNSDIHCQHVWKAIAQCYRSAVIALPQEPECNLCLENRNQMLQHMHELEQQASSESVELKGLKGRKSRLMSLKDLAKECSQGAASLYILPESFVTKWRQWLKSPRTMARPAKRILCKHGDLLYDLNGDLNENWTGPVDALGNSPSDESS
eukprot:gene1152-4371_t